MSIRRRVRMRGSFVLAVVVVAVWALLWSGFGGGLLAHPAQDTPSTSHAQTACHYCFSGYATASPQTGNAPLQVTFNAVVTFGLPPITFSWTFGDGGTSTAQNPVHTYLHTGSYTPTVVMTEHGGIQIQAGTTVNVYCGASSISSVSVSTSATTALVTWTNSPATGSVNTFLWGPTSSLGYQAFAGGSQASLQYLQPSTTYSYEITLTNTCYSSSTYFGTFSTGAGTTPTSLSGTVYDTTGATAPAGVGLDANCVSYSGSSGWSNVGTTTALAKTTSTGTFTISVPGPQSGSSCGGYQIDEGVSGQWPNHFTETLFVFPYSQSVNFYLEPDAAVPVVTVPLFVEYAHSPYVSYTLGSTQTWTTTTTAMVGGNGVSASITDTATTTYTATQGRNLEGAYAQNFEGRWAFDAVNGRTFTLTGLTAVGNPVFTLGGNLFPSDKMTLSQIVNNPRTLTKTIQYGYSASYQWTFAGSVTLAAGFDGSISIGASIFGIDVGGSVKVQFQLSQTVSSTYTISFTLNNNDPAKLTHTFYIFPQGSAASATGIILHTWST
jgi:PKD repeat protein